MPHLGYHAVYESDFPTALRAASEHGFQFVQFDLNVPSFYVDALSRRQLKDINSMAADLGVGISFHAPGDNVSLFTDYPLIRKGMLDHLKLILQKASFLHAHHLTVHPLSPPSFRRADTLHDSFQAEHHDYFKQVFKENMKALAEASGGVMITVENCHLRKIAIDALTELFQEGTDVFLALDWAKMHKSDGMMDEDQRLFFTRHKRRIRELHLHDLDGEGRSHLGPGQGSLDFGALFGQFHEPIQYLTVEVRPILEAAKARDKFLHLMEGKGEA